MTIPTTAFQTRAAPGFVVERDGDDLVWRCGGAMERQSIVAFLSEGPPDRFDVPAAGFQDREGFAPGLQQLILGALAPERDAGAAVYAWAQAKLRRLGDAAQAAALVRVGAAGGPVEALRVVLSSYGGANAGLSKSTLKLFERLAYDDDLPSAIDRLAEVAADRPYLWRDAATLAVWAGRRASLADEVAAIALAEGSAATELARGLWEVCRTKGADLGPEALDVLRGHAAPNVAFFAACAARQLARGVPLPALEPLTGEKPDLSAPLNESSTRTSSITWVATEGATVASHVSPPRCRLCASDDVEVTFYRNDSGTGWRSETLEGRCRECGGVTTVDVED
jgi:hypothetical protein